MFSLVSVSEKESKLLLSYLRNLSKTPAYDFIDYLIGADYIKFLDILSGFNLKIPNRRSLYRDIEYIKIYNYVREKKFSVESIRASARIYNKNIAFVKRAILKMSKILNEKIPFSLEELNNIKSLAVEDGKNFNSCNDGNIKVARRTVSCEEGDE